MPAILLSPRAVKSIGKKRLLKAPAWLPADTAAREYERFLLSILKRLRALVKERVLTKLPSLIQQNKARGDDLQDDITDAFASVSLTNVGISDSILLEMLNIARKTSNFNKAQFDKLAQKTLGVDLFIEEPYLEQELRMFAKQNAKIAESFVGKTLQDLDVIVFNAVKAGIRYEEIGRMIQKKFRVQENTAKFIARDQVGKLDGELTRLRQKQIGVTKYRWITSLDERVRPEHRERHGKIFSWDNPPRDGHVRQSPRCRCYAEAILEDIQAYPENPRLYDTR